MPGVLSYTFYSISLAPARCPSILVTTYICLSLPRAAYARAGLSTWFCPSVVVVVVHKNICITADLEAKTISKQEVNDENRHILACVYLVKHRAVSFSAISTFF